MPKSSYNPVVVDMMVIDNNDGHKSIQFDIMGEAGVQNGWKLAWRGCSRPYIYDPNQKQKQMLQKAVKQAMKEFNIQTLLFKEESLKIKVVFHMNNVNSKDADNMLKFLQRYR